MAFSSIEGILMTCKERQISFFEVVLEDDIVERTVTREKSFADMYGMWDAMFQASAAYEEKRKSSSGLVGGQGGLLREYGRTVTPLCGEFVNQVMCQALEMGESNACMKRIVAAPTAGSSGVLPAVLIPYYRKYKIKPEAIVESLFVAGGIGQVIASRAYIAGAAGGCQAEIGSASAMAAGALVALRGGSPEQISYSVAISLKNLLGLVCDPVAGLVEVPCVKRNVIGAVNALSAADMALAGIASAIPADQVIDAMKEVGDKMDVSLRETGRGGLAATPMGVSITKSLKI